MQRRLISAVTALIAVIAGAFVLPATAGSAPTPTPLSAAGGALAAAGVANTNLHLGEVTHSPDGFTTYTYAELPPGVTSYTPAPGTTEPTFVTVTGAGSQWVTSVIRPSQLKVWRTPPERPTITNDGIYCLGQVNQPQWHPHAFGTPIGIVTVTDVVDCNAGDVNVEDDLWLYSDEVPQGHAHIQELVHITVFGFLTVNEASAECINTFQSGWWGRMLTGVWVPGTLLGDTNKPAGFDGPVLGLNCY